MKERRQGKTIRELLLLAHERDAEAVTALLGLLEDDLTRVVYKNIANHALAETVLHDVYVRIFFYLPRFRQEFVHRASTPDPDGDRRCLDKLRRWATNLARNWVRTVNHYGLETAERWLLPRGPVPKGTPRYRAFKTLSLDAMRWHGEDGEPGEDPLDLAPIKAAAAGRHVA